MRTSIDTVVEPVIDTKESEILPGYDFTQTESYTTIDIYKSLKEYFGYENFRGLQEKVIQNILNHKDAFVIMPTGAGKSLCYQLPATVLEGTALVVSPLIALMKNQVDQMTSLGIEAGYLNSSMTKLEYEHVKQKAIDRVLKLLYVAPETLVRDEFIDFVKQIQLTFVAVDEAHCISEWGHDFRPEYRKIRPILNQMHRRVPIIALTATATPKVQIDVQKNLQIEEAYIFKTSFNRENLYYEIRPKTSPVPEIVKFIKHHDQRSGIVYCLSRRKVEEIAELLNMNGIKSVPYHAGLDSDTRSKHQDMFLHEDVQVVVATIAFGMGIDKPDVRYVIHYDVPKSIESYYQETGRAGRDGLEGHCVLFYNFNDIIKLEKFMKDKPLSEREASKHLLYEMAAFCESGVCRRKQLLHYFGEKYDENQCNKKCDNCRNPRELFDASDEVFLALKCIKEMEGRYGIMHIINVLRGVTNQQIKDLKHHELSTFGKGEETEEKYWKSILIQLVVNDFLTKDINHYGVIKLSEKGIEFVKNPYPIKLFTFVDFTDLEKEQERLAEEVKPYDAELFQKLVNLRREIAKQHKLPPYIIFQEFSLEEIATKYPLTISEFENITGVGSGKAKKYAKPFIDLIKKHVEEFEIERSEQIVVKTQGKNSADKLFIIQQIDRKIPLDEIAKYRDLNYDELLEKIEQIIFSGSKLNIDYHIYRVIDEDKIDEIYDFFRNSESDCLENAHNELGNYFTLEEIQLVRAKFYSEMAN